MTKQNRSFQDTDLHVGRLFAGEKLIGPPGVPGSITTSFTANKRHCGRLNRLESASAIVCTLPLDAGNSNDFIEGDMICLVWWGVGATSFAAAGGVTIRVKLSAGLNLSERYASAWAIKVGPNEWLIDGGLAA